MDSEWGCGMRESCRGGWGHLPRMDPERDWGRREEEEEEGPSLACGSGGGEWRRSRSRNEVSPPT